MSEKCITQTCKNWRLPRQGEEAGQVIPQGSVSGEGEITVVPTKTPGAGIKGQRKLPTVNEVLL